MQESQKSDLAGQMNDNMLVFFSEDECMADFWKEDDCFADLWNMEDLPERRYYEAECIDYFEWLGSLEFVVKHAKPDVCLLILSGGYFIDIFLTIGEAQHYANEHYSGHHVTVVSRDDRGHLVFSDRDTVRANE